MAQGRAKGKSKSKRRASALGLVLTRSAGQRVVLTTPDGGRIHVTVAQVRGDRVRLGFLAEDGVTVHREEVQRELDRGVYAEKAS